MREEGSGQNHKATEGEREWRELTWLGILKKGGGGWSWKRPEKEKRNPPHLSRNRALVCLESRRRRGRAQQRKADILLTPKGLPCLKISWQLGFSIMPLFIRDEILASKCSSYLFRRTHEPHLHSDRNNDSVYLACGHITWKCSRLDLDYCHFCKLNIRSVRTVNAHPFHIFISVLLWIAEALHMPFFCSANDLQIYHTLLDWGQRLLLPELWNTPSLNPQTVEQWGDASFYLPVVLLRVFPVKLWKPKTCKVPNLAAYFGQKIPLRRHCTPKRKLGISIVQIRLF